MAAWLNHNNAPRHRQSHARDLMHIDDDAISLGNHPLHHHDFRKDMLNGLLRAPSRSQTPVSYKYKSTAERPNNPGSVTYSQSGQGPNEHDAPVEEDEQVVKFRALYETSEAKIADMFDSCGQIRASLKRKRDQILDSDSFDQHTSNGATQSQSKSVLTSVLTSKKRKLDDDDYDDYDEEEEDEEEDEEAEDAGSPLKSKSSKVQIVGDMSPQARPALQSRPSSDDSNNGAGSVKKKDDDKPEDARRNLEEAKIRETETVRNLSRTLFFTLENDADAILEQQRLDEAERQAEREAEGHMKVQQVTAQQGSLANANLGASSLTLKNLIARIDQYRSSVQATESELRALMSEVRKNRSKWANEDKVGQEELYEAAEKVLNELKAQTEHSTPFLTAVKKKDAPDYHRVILHPMDLGTMTKKLKSLVYKSKQEFVDDLHLTWANCLKYNSAPDHPMRKHALHMRKETDKLVPLIPEIVIRDRLEVEAEERKQRIADGDVDDGVEDSDDEPIMASRGRKAPSKKTSKAPNTARKSLSDQTPAPETKPTLSQLNASSDGLAGPDTEMDVTSQGTPPPGMLTPTLDRFGAGSVVETQSEMPDSEVPTLPFSTAPPEIEDEDHKLWRQRTKKERAQIAAARHRLFRGDKLNQDEEALLRKRSAMRRWQRSQLGNDDKASLMDIEMDRPQDQGMLADGLDNIDESMLPDYYHAQAALPSLNHRLLWKQDAQGELIDQQEEYLRLFPSNLWTAPQSKVTSRVFDNMKQIQETRKIVSKIAVVKQMQIQQHIHQNQFTKHDPVPLLETDISAHVMNDAGPLVAPWVSRAALTRSVGEIFFHAGFEDYQPSSLDTITDIASDFMLNLCSDLANYLNETKTPLRVPLPVDSELKLPLLNTTPTCQPYPLEEAVLHALHTSGLSLTSIHEYATDELDRAASRLSTMYTRMRSHYADLLKPAVTDETSQGQGAFDSGEQFTSGDFADELGEDFFGFKELGLDKEFGLVNMSVPLHLLRSRLATNATANTSQITNPDEKLFTPPPPYPRVNIESIDAEIGLMKNYFRARLRENSDRPLPEDQDLPVKQRKGYGKARVPATGKIGDGKAAAQVSPQKKASARPSAVTTKSTAGGVSKAKPKQILNGSERRDSYMTDRQDEEDDENGAPTPYTNGVNEDAEEDDISAKGRLKTPQKPKIERKQSKLSIIDDGDALNGDVSMNGLDSPSQGGMNRKKANKTKQGEDGMISPESL